MTTFANTPRILEAAIVLSEPGNCDIDLDTGTSATAPSKAAAGRHRALAKLPCGLSPEASCAPEPPLAPACMDGGMHLLAAALAHAGMPPPMTVPAFRAAFQRRRGVLNAFAGSWLLQVERQAHEQSPDHLPWSQTCLRPPLMPGSLQVGR